MHQSHTKKRAAIAALALVPVILSPFAVLAQDSGGFTLQVVVEQSLEASSNLALSAESAGTTTQSLTQLSFHIASETHVSALSLDAAFGLRAANGPATDGTELTATDPRIALAYSQRAANASFEINADYTQSDIAYSRLSDFVDPVSGELTLPDDISDLQGTGTRQSLNFGATLRLREDAPLGVTLTASVADLSYRDTSSAELFDNRRTRLGTTVRL
ncbi:MAG: hypothetical protein JKX69_07875, partial [Rhodobacteraceae bacterium]|nr:hypothetical protein [Paracoccaceae bacterium]